MEHKFNTNIASVTGVDGAIMMNHLFYWIQKNAANNKNFHDGRCWTYNSADAFTKIFRYWTGKQVRRIIDNLILDGYIIKGNYNENRLDRTAWFTFTDKGIELLKSNDYDTNSLDLPKWENANDETGKCITNNNTTNNKEDKKENLISKDISQKSGKSEIELRFDEGMNKAYPRVMHMQFPLTFDQYNKLLEKGYTSEQIKSTLEDMENWTKLPTKSYACRTLSKWLSKN